MRVYFVRHGESTANAEEVHYGASALLTDVGRDQAKLIARRVATLPIEIIITSHFPRAKDTAAIIAQKIQKPVEENKFFAERRLASELSGKSFHDPLRKEIFQQARAHADDPTWRYSDEENFVDLKARAEAALAFLAGRNEEHLLVVTHGVFMRLLLGSMLFGAEFTSSQYKLFRSFFQTSNTGITVCEYLLPDEEHTEPRWRLITWNDHAHLS